MSALADAQRLVRDLLVSVGQLAANVHGTRLPYRPSGVSPETRAARDSQARQERHERVDVAPGDSPDLYAFGVVDQLMQILVVADHLAELVGQAAVQVPLPLVLPPHAPSAYADPTPYLRFIRDFLVDAEECAPGTAREVEHALEPLWRRAEETLGHVVDGQLLAGLCPFCGGRTDTAPVGGERTLRVRLIPASPQPRPAVVCEGGHCEPTTAECGLWWRGRPAWDLENEGEWLADRLSRTTRPEVA